MLAPFADLREVQSGMNKVLGEQGEALGGMVLAINGMPPAHHAPPGNLTRRGWPVDMPVGVSIW
jgi:hypothetical protein